ncbi:lysoplasmalogenase [Olleya sp. YS]|uniref:lysoplasmalogenase n=1 Tax=Olleya sp. YS TaxID=3028318 RepID=UPI00243427BA|nr:lysoplasmalogenase [Olleya sp. YS]WGD34926.1 lysoplasmalogenase [Olleya sp. YS]
MKSIFKNLTYFTLFYFFLFAVDAYVKVFFLHSLLRYITKGALIIALLYYFILNNNDTSQRNIRLIVLAICSFLIGDELIIAGNINRYFFVLGVIFFGIGKILYSIRFSHKKDFNTLKLLPFLLFCFSYMSVVMMIIYDNLNSYFIPVLIYLFIVMLTAQFAFLRRSEVNNISYFLVLIGVVFSMFSDSITLLKEFYSETIAYNQYTIMLFYALSQYFIVIGLVKERKKLIMMQY